MQRSHMFMNGGPVGVVEEPQPSDLYAVLVTWRRPRSLNDSLAALSRQSTRPRRTVVVDNDPEGSARAVVKGLETDLDIDYICVGSNSGPAGGRSTGADRILELASDRDWILMLDDDDPLPSDSLVESLFGFATAEGERDPGIAGVGLRGASFDLLRGRAVWRDPSDVDSIDHLHGGFFPLYSAEAIRSSGGFAPELFYGFEELELGLRLTRMGYRLVVHDSLMEQLRTRIPHADPRPRPKLRLETPDWRRYYSLRNLLYILRRNDAPWWVVARAALIRGIGKPLVNLPLRPRLAWAHLRLNAAAIRDAYKGRMYLTVEPRDDATA